MSGWLLHLVRMLLALLRLGVARSAFPSLPDDVRERLARRGIDPEASYEAMLDEVSIGGGLVDDLLAAVESVRPPRVRRRRVLATLEGRCGLSPKELAVMRGLADGRRLEEIAEEMNYSLWTVKDFVGCAYRKLGVADVPVPSAKAVAILMREGAIS